jgi:hypothetical protein
LPERFGEWSSVFQRFTTPGQEYVLAKCLLAEHEPNYVIADKGYDSDRFLDHFARHGSTAVIPSRSGRTVQRRVERS